MPVVLLAVLLFATFVGFAIYGFVVAMARLFGNQSDNQPPQNDNTTVPSPKESILGKDVGSATRLLNHLLLTRRLAPEPYRRIRKYLENEFGDEYQLAENVETLVDKPVEAEPTVAERTDDDQIVEVLSEPAVDGSESMADAELVSEKTISTAPWDIPDPPPPEPTRSFNEMLSTFMLDKNIRWGELASGILIVGSAVGLVISLRNELQDTIPYFSALLFLLITAAIHAAGIYTLNKWRLRNTSRGTLLIGLLLIPLNFLAACILSNEDVHRRELNDPLLWTAVLVGLTSFTLMTWFSGKHLFRQGQAPLVYSIIGSAIATLAINRTEGIDESTFVKLGLTCLLVSSFLSGTVFVIWNQWRRDHWPRRSIFRMLICFGIAAFAFVNGAAMLVIRAEENPPTWVALAPSFAVVALMGAWLGHVIWIGAKGKDTKPLTITGLAMLILGLVVVGITWLVAFSNPTVLLFISALLTIGFFLFAYQRVESRLLIPAWIAFASFVLCGINLLSQNLPWDSWTSIGQLFNVTFSGRSGITLLVVGALVTAFHFVASKSTTNPQRFTTVGLISGAVLFVAGLLLTITASFLNRANQFDVMTATILLALAAALALGANLLIAIKHKGTLRPNIVGWSAAVSTLVLLFFFGHAFVWNLTLAKWLDETAFAVRANWQIIFAMSSMVLAAINVLGHWLNPSRDKESYSTQNLIAFSHHFALHASIAGALAIGLGLNLIRSQTGLATIIVLLVSIGALLLAWSYDRYKLSNDWSGVFTLLSGLVVAFCVAEIFVKQDWCPGIGDPKHWLIQITTLSGWFVLWMVVNWLLTKWQTFGFLAIPDRIAESIATGLAFGLTLLVTISLVLESNVELFADASTPKYQLGREGLWISLSVTIVFFALLITTFKRTSVTIGAAVVIVWTVGWASIAFYWIDEKAVATGMRWIIPIGGAIGAGLVAARKPLVMFWVVARNKLGLAGKSCWAPISTQHLINLSLTLIAGSVLTISTIAIVQVIVFGGVESLGGPIKGTLFGDMKKDVSYGLPVGIIVNTFLLYAISERRKWLATAGSLVFQYCVILSVILLFVSPHPKLASSWFVNILQAVSVGMTGYGFVWWYFRKRVESDTGNLSTADTASTLGSDSSSGRSKTSQLQVHSVINGVLISSLAVLVMTRFFRFPTVSGDWINSVGGPLGLGAWAFYGVLVILVWREQLQKTHRASSWLWLTGWTGLVLVGMLAALVDRNIANDEVYEAWTTFNLITWGALIVTALQVALLFVLGPLGVAMRWKPPHADAAANNSSYSSLRTEPLLPILFTGFVVLFFGFKGMFFVENFWSSFWPIAVLIAIWTVAGFVQQSGIFGFVTAITSATAAIILVQQDPSNWFTQPQPYIVNVPAVVLTVLATIWSGYFVIRSVTFGFATTSRMNWMSNATMFFVSVWLLLGALAQWLIETDGNAKASSLKNEWGIGLFATAAILCLIQTWNQARKGLVIAASCWSVSMTIFLTAIWTDINGFRNTLTIFHLSLLVATLGMLWKTRNQWSRWLTYLRVPRVENLQRSLRLQLPMVGTLVSAAVVIAAFAIVLLEDARILRYFASFSPFGLAVGFGCWSDNKGRRWIQLLSLTLLTIGATLVAWSDLEPGSAQYRMRLPVRTLLVFAVAIFLYGAIVSQYVRKTDTWLRSLKEMAVATSMLALCAFLLVVWIEYSTFIPDVGCGMLFYEAVAVAVAVLCMITGLIVLAAIDEYDPFGLSIEGRMGYAYAAQFVIALLVMHLFFTMPFLFRFGIKEYWPYILLFVSFAGIGFAHLLQQKNLRVLAEPIFNSGTVLPLIIALAIWPIASKADHALVIMLVGMLYLLISYTHQSLLHGIAAIVFGNLSIWLFYDKFEGFSFVDHPQLWLIPPAFSVLVAAQISKQRLTNSQLAAIRYLCAATIYLSSTVEIFMNGLGKQLWPPMVLAVLSVAGIFVGILFQVRAYLYLGALFLLMAMITMISHAHQQLEHVWPWWAFGISMGIAILIMFGLFEKRKNSMNQVLRQLQQWDP